MKMEIPVLTELAAEVAELRVRGRCRAGGGILAVLA
jgi:hypothetical protein